MGAANHFHDRYGTPVYTDPVEVRHAHRDYLEQATTLDVAANLWRPGVLPWLTRVMRVGVTQKVSIPSAEPFPDPGPLDLPGNPVPVPTHGHTSGHTAYHLPRIGAILTGDELVTAHAVIRHTGPQVLPAFFNHGNPLQARQPVHRAHRARAPRRRPDPPRPRRPTTPANRRRRPRGPPTPLTVNRTRRPTSRRPARPSPRTLHTCGQRAQMEMSASAQIETDPERAAFAHSSRSVNGDGRRRRAIQMRLRLPRTDTGAVAPVAPCIP